MGKLQMKDSSKNQAMKRHWDQGKRAEHTYTPVLPFALHIQKTSDVAHIENLHSK